MSTPRDVLEELLAGVGAGRWEQLPQLYAPDTVVEHPLARDQSRMLRGRDALVAHFDRIAQTGIRLTARPPTLYDTGDPELVIAEFTYDGKTAEGTTFDVAACFIWRVRDGLIVSARDYLGALPTS